MEEEHPVGNNSANADLEIETGSQDTSVQRASSASSSGPGFPPAPPPAEANRRGPGPGPNINDPTNNDRRRLPLPPPNRSASSSQSVLRQQAASPDSSSFGGPGAVGGYELSIGSAGWQNPQSLQAHDNQLPSEERRNEDDENGPEEEEDVEHNSCGWSEVELSQNPGLAPSARSLHAAALLVSCCFLDLCARFPCAFLTTTLFWFSAVCITALTSLERNSLCFRRV